MDNDKDSIRQLIDIMSQLRSTSGCEWDRQQSPASLKKHILEEAYELLEAIDKGSPDDICDELGDLLLQVVFQAQIFSEDNHFTIYDVAAAINRKLIRRHPHIFADASQEGHEQRWEEIKQLERAESGQPNTLAARIPKTLPALKRASKAIKKTMRPDPIEQIHQLQEQLSSLADQLNQRPDKQSRLDERLSELLMDVCKLSVAINLDPEELLRKKTTQLISLFDSNNHV